MNTSVNLAGIEFKNPVLTSSGTFGYGLEFKDAVPLNRLGGIISKTVTLDERRGNPPPRLSVTASGMLNSVGLQNVGIEKFVEDKLPKMIVVQSTNCAPVVDFIAGKPIVNRNYKGSVANGLAVPKVLGIDMIYKVVKESKGFAVTVSEQEILYSLAEFSSNEGISVAPEGAAIWGALKNLVNQNIILMVKINTISRVRSKNTFIFRLVLT